MSLWDWLRGESFEPGWDASSSWVLAVERGESAPTAQPIATTDGAPYRSAASDETARARDDQAIASLVITTCRARPSKKKPTYDTELRKVVVADGSLRLAWSTPMHEDACRRGFVGRRGDLVIFADAPGGVRAVDIATGETRWTVEGGRLAECPAEVDGLLHLRFLRDRYTDVHPDTGVVVESGRVWSPPEGGTPIRPRDVSSQSSVTLGEATVALEGKTLVRTAAASRVELVPPAGWYPRTPIVRVGLDVAVWLALEEGDRGSVALAFLDGETLALQSMAHVGRTPSSTTCDAAHLVDGFLQVRAGFGSDDDGGLASGTALVDLSARVVVAQLASAHYEAKSRLLSPKHLLWEGRP